MYKFGANWLQEYVTGCQLPVARLFNGECPPVINLQLI
jgi:hypothetical protein